jgi:hypothetical protein
MNIFWESVLFASTLMFITFWLIPKSLSWIFRFKENILIIKMKNEIRAGNGSANYYPSGPACHTRCDFNLSLGSFSTTLDPVSSSFGVHRTVEWDIKNSNGLNTEWIGKKMHRWMQ